MNGRWLTVISMMLLAACVDATEELTEKPTQGLPDNVKEVFRRSIENLVFGGGGGFRWGTWEPTSRGKVSMKAH